MYNKTYSTTSHMGLNIKTCIRMFQIWNNKREG